ncbi:hypothetical protein HYC85_016036 [Camellia sinensis]|uniref:Uncharacterized protein n=1 Tax=Camellia sinensis TaxID=4442 RepID=A0A7J7H263_CAMSI|nr:hypothetical protein HYC85_016036 [Camellia sinensis]
MVQMVASRSRRERGDDDREKREEGGRRGRRGERIWLCFGVDLSGEGEQSRRQGGRRCGQRRRQWVTTEERERAEGLRETESKGFEFSIVWHVYIYIQG